MKRWFCLAVLFALVPAPARADMMTFSFQGLDTLAAGSPVPVTGILTYDSNGTLVSQNGGVSMFSTTGTLSITEAGQTYSTDGSQPLLIRMTAYQIDFGNPDGVFPNLGLQVGNGHSTLFTNLNVLPNALSLTGTTGQFNIVTNVGSPPFKSSGSLTNLDPGPPQGAPEPGSLTLLGMGLIGLAVAARRRLR